MNELAIVEVMKKTVIDISEKLREKGKSERIYIPIYLPDGGIIFTIDNNKENKR